MPTTLSREPHRSRQFWSVLPAHLRKKSRLLAYGEIFTCRLDNSTAAIYLELH